MNKRCKCGAGAWIEGDAIHIEPHEMGCAVLDVLEAAGSGWIREELNRLDAEMTALSTGGTTWNE